MEKVTVIQEMSPPQTVKEVRSFIGMCSYYRRYVPNFSEQAIPIIALTRKNATFIWSEDCQEAFDSLKICLTNAPVLAHADPQKPYVLYTDASQGAVGAILAQKDNQAQERVVHYLSQQLNRRQRNWATIEKEAWAIVFALKRLRQYLLGAKFTVYTDHKPLKSLFVAPIKNARIERWGILINEFQCDIQYRPGHSMKADFVSRINGPMPAGAEEDVGEESMAMDIGQLNEGLEEYDPADLPADLDALRKLQASESDIKEIRDSLLADGETSTYAKEYILDEEVVYKIANLVKNDKEHRLQLVVPLLLVKGILFLLHDQQGHLGADQTHNVIRRRYFWQNSYRDIVKYIGGCTVCNARKMTANKIPIQSMPIPQTPFQTIAIDISGPFPETENGEKYMLTIICLFSGWPECFVIPNKETATVARVLCEEFFPRHAYPETMISDRGTKFCSEVIEILAKKLQICRIKTSPYRPEANGKVERLHRVLNDVIPKRVATDQSDWPRHIPLAMQAIRTTIHTGAWYSPYFLAYGRDPKLSLDYLLRPKFKVHWRGICPHNVTEITSCLPGRTDQLDGCSGSQPTNQKQRQHTAWNRRGRYGLSQSKSYLTWTQPEAEQPLATILSSFGKEVTGQLRDKTCAHGWCQKGACQSSQISWQQ